MRHLDFTSKSARKEQGFSLIESLVALAIFATSVVIGLNTLNNTLKQLTMLEDRHLASSLASNMAHQWYLFEPSSIPHSLSTQFANRQWKIINTQETIPQTSLTKLVISVYPDSETPTLQSQAGELTPTKTELIDAPLHSLTLLLRRDI